MKRPLLAALAALLLALSCASYANTQQENADLALVVRQLQAVYPLIYQAEQQANTNARQIFHYDWLRADLAKIINGINQKLKPLPLEPRKVQPIKGDYLSMRSGQV